jgi:hypothetical protein
MAELMRNRMFWAGGSLVVGLLQAWDSNAFQADGVARLLVVTGVVLPSVAIAAAAGRRAALVALIGGALLLTAARTLSPVPMNALHIALLVPAIYVLFVSRIGAAAANLGLRRGPH